MIKITMGGKPFKAKDFEKHVTQMAFKAICENVRARLSVIRHPITGEFPTVIVLGDAFNDVGLRVEGSKELLEIVKKRLTPEDLQIMTLVPTDLRQTPKAFLSFSWQDIDLARKIAEGLQANGIETWWAEWEIKAGDSIRRKIDAGLEGCTHFIVLLTPASIDRPWVQEEVDAGFVRKVNEESRFIVLRHLISTKDLPPLMKGILSPEIDADASNLQQLINDIHGLSGKPPLGPAPAALKTPATDYSAAASKIAGLFVASSANGLFGDIQERTASIAEATGLTLEDVEDALYELRHFVKITHDRVMPKEALYVEFDKYFQPWDPEQDALHLAVEMMNDPDMPTVTKEIAERLSWPPRRLNPAITYLGDRELARVSKAIGSGLFVCVWVEKTDATRRFVKSRQ